MMYSQSPTEVVGRDMLPFVQVTVTSRTKELQLSVLIPFRFVNLCVEFPGFHSSFFCQILGPVFTIVPLREKESVRIAVVL